MAALLHAERPQASRQCLMSENCRLQASNLALKASTAPTTGSSTAVEGSGGVSTPQLHRCAHDCHPSADKASTASQEVRFLWVCEPGEQNPFGSGIQRVVHATPHGPPDLCNQHRRRHIQTSRMHLKSSWLPFRAFLERAVLSRLHVQVARIDHFQFCNCVLADNLIKSYS
jgi:hypothetical protein